MHTWKLKNAQHRLRELVRMALTKEPQRLSNGKDAVVVIAASEYDRLLGAMPKEAGTRETPCREERPCHGGARPRAPAMEGRKWVWEWDEKRQRWALPWEDDVDPAEHPGLEFLNAMQNSPLADMFRTGEITPEEWAALVEGR